jgi:MFS family permease
MLTFSSYGTTVWMPTYFIRHFHWTAGHIGVVFGTLAAVFGSLGILGSGWVADRMAARGHKDAYLRVAFWISILWYPTGIAVFLMPTPVLACVLLAPTIALGAGSNCVGPAALMQVTPQRMRGQAAAIYLFVINLIGLGVGPTAVALCTDYVFRNDNMVGYSLLIVTCAAHAIAAVCLWHGRQSYVRSLQAANDWVETRAA